MQFRSHLGLIMPKFISVALPALLTLLILCIPNDPATIHIKTNLEFINNNIKTILLCIFRRLMSENRRVVGTVRMSDWFNRPLLLELDNAFDHLTRGLATQEQDFSDQFWDSEITQFLFK